MHQSEHWVGAYILRTQLGDGIYAEQSHARLHLAFEDLTKCDQS